MKTPHLDILWMYPGILNLHGDRGNLMALMRVRDQLGVQARLTRVDRLTGAFDLNKADVVWFGPGELTSIATVTRHLLPRVDEFRSYVDDGGTMLVVGTTAALVAKSTKRTDGHGFDGLGLLDMFVGERAQVYGDDLIVDADGMELGGFQIRLTDAHLANNQSPFAHVLYGIGDDPARPDVEGARRNNLIATNLLGPLLVRNPWFAARLIETAVARRFPGVTLHAPDADAWHFETLAAQAVRRFNATKALAPGTIRSPALMTDPTGGAA